jgi:hypothetical protein
MKFGVPGGGGGSRYETSLSNHECHENWITGCYTLFKGVNKIPLIRSILLDLFGRDSIHSTSNCP